MAKIAITTGIYWAIFRLAFRLLFQASKNVTKKYLCKAFVESLLICIQKHLSIVSRAILQQEEPEMCPIQTCSHVPRSITIFSITIML